MRLLTLHLTLTFCIALSACQKPEIKACEAWITSGLKSPSTYRQIDVTQSDAFLSREEYRKRDGNTALADTLFDALKPAERSVFITYDAENSYGVPIRDVTECKFNVHNGELRPEGKSLKLQIDSLIARRDLIGAVKASGQLHGQTGRSEPPLTCCNQ